MAHPPGDAIGQQAGQGSVDCGVRLAEDERQLRRIDERRLAKEVDQLSFGERQVGVFTPSLGRVLILLSAKIAQLPLSPRNTPYVMPCRPSCWRWFRGRDRLLMMIASQSWYNSAHRSKEAGSWPASPCAIWTTG